MLLVAATVNADVGVDSMVNSLDLVVFSVVAMKLFLEEEGVDPSQGAVAVPLFVLQILVRFLTRPIVAAQTIRKSLTSVTLIDGVSFW